MGAEFNTVADFIGIAKAENLKSAAVCKDWPPVHKSVQSSRLGNQVMARPQIQMVCIGENYLGVDNLQLVCGHGLDSGLGSHRHKNRRLDAAVGCMENSGASSSL